MKKFIVITVLIIFLAVPALGLLVKGSGDNNQNGDDQPTQPTDSPAPVAPANVSYVLDMNSRGFILKEGQSTVRELTDEWQTFDGFRKRLRAAPYTGSENFLVALDLGLPSERIVVYVHERDQYRNLGRFTTLSFKRLLRTEATIEVWVLPREGSQS